MNCPLCNVMLQMSERQGVEIDFCPKCRGVWLDRGELDKIIERANQEVNVKPPQYEKREGAYDRHHDKAADRYFRRLTVDAKRSFNRLEDRFHEKASLKVRPEKCREGKQ